MGADSFVWRAFRRTRAHDHGLDDHVHHGGHRRPDRETLDSGGEISNLTLDNVQITTGDGQFYVGALVGKNRGTVRNGRVTGTVNAGNGSIGGLAGWNGDPTINDVGSIVDSSALVGITATTTSATIGGLVGTNTEGSTIQDSHAEGPVTVNGAGNLIGGLVGNNVGSVSGSYATGNVHLEDVVKNDGLSSYVGGLVGENQGSVQDSYATGNVSGKGGSRANYGGLVGYNLNGAIVRSHGAGGVGVADVPNALVGGLVGFNDTGEMAPNPAIIEYSYSKGQVEVSSSDNAGVGGLVGNNRGSVKISYAMGNVVVGSGDRSSVGGLVGIHDSPGTIENSYAEGAVQGGGSNFDVGGLVGDNWAGMVNSYAFGKVTTEPSASVGCVGGLIGYNEGVGTADGCYWDVDPSGQKDGFGTNDNNANPPVVTGKSTSEMKQQSTFEGWDFAYIWGIDPGKSRPFLLALFSGGLAFEPPQYEMNVGESRDAVLSAQYSDGNRWHITTWATVVSSDPGVADVAKVEPVWKVTGNQAGTATLTASFPNLADVPNNLPDATATVKVVSPSSGGGGGGSGPVLLRLVVRPESLELKVGESGSLQVYTEYAGGWKQDVTELATYRSSDPAVAEVDSLGRATAKAPGTAEITVTYQGKTVQLQVTFQRVTPQGPDFTDIKGHWAEALIREAAARGWVTGFPDGSFRPDQPVTRGEFAVMAMKVFGWAPPEGPSLPYLDRDGIPDWARDAVAAGTVLGVLKGYDDGYFRPDRLISRAELGVIIAKAAGLPVMAGAHTTFADDSAIPEWARRFVAVAQEAGLLVGRGDNQFEPEGLTTRAEAVAVLLKTAAGQNSGGGTASAPSVAE